MPFMLPVFGAIGAGMGVTGAGVTAGTSIAAGMAISGAALGGAALGATALSQGKKKETPSVPQITQMPNAPTPVAAQESAQSAMDAKKRMRALAGGKTLLTSDSPILSSTGGKTLLGS